MHGIRDAQALTLNRPLRDEHTRCTLAALRCRFCTPPALPCTGCIRDADLTVGLP